jgi:hypothetical protein
LTPPRACAINASTNVSRGLASARLFAQQVRFAAPGLTCGYCGRRRRLA